MKLLAIFLGGGAGSLARYGLGALVTKCGWASPLGTLLSNVLATGLLLWILSLAASETFGIDPKASPWFALLTIGFCGAFSTYSTFAADTVQLYDAQGWLWAAVNVAANLVLCLGVAAWLWHSTSGAA